MSPKKKKKKSIFCMYLAKDCSSIDVIREESCVYHVTGLCGTIPKFKI